tara:strand:- start:358 stop:696 length:339 start_codon:yes stop_codon:yes gene_type:complete
MQIETDIETLYKELDNWGWWAQEDDTRKLNYSSGITSSGRSVKITDDRAMELDRAIASLGSRLKRVVRLRFICGFDSHRLAMALDVTEESAAEMISNSVVRVHEYLVERMVA